MLKHPTKHKKRIPIKPKYRISIHKNNPNHIVVYSSQSLISKAAWIKWPKPKTMHSEVQHLTMLVLEVRSMYWKNVVSYMKPNTLQHCWLKTLPQILSHCWAKFSLPGQFNHDSKPWQHSINAYSQGRGNTRRRLVRGVWNLMLLTTVDMKH